MVDKLTSSARSENMRRIKSHGTKPEQIVRKATFALGYRYRLHRKDLKGKPDLVFGKRRKVIFVHGCFWHGHDVPTCPDRRVVKSNLHYWQPKIEGNRARDQRNEDALIAAGWQVLTIWECETRQPERLMERLVSFLGPPTSAETG